MLRWLFRTVINLALCAALAVVILLGGSYIYRTVTGNDSFFTEDFFPGAKAGEKSPAAQNPQAADSGGVKVTLEIDQAQGAALLQSALSPVLTLKNVELTLRADGSAALTGDIGRNSLKTALNRNTEIPQLILSAIELLPEDISVSIELDSATVENGEIKLEPSSFGVEGLSIGAQFLPEGVMDAINNQLNSYAAQNGVRVSGIEITEGKIRLGGELVN